jgi:hypothetical protein
MSYKFNIFTGTFDLVSEEDITNLVPYTGATTNVNLGDNSLTVEGNEIIEGLDTYGLDDNNVSFFQFDDNLYDFRNNITLSFSNSNNPPKYFNFPSVRGKSVYLLSCGLYGYLPSTFNTLENYSFGGFFFLQEGSIFTQEINLLRIGGNIHENDYITLVRNTNNQFGLTFRRSSPSSWQIKIINKNGVPVVPIYNEMFSLIVNIEHPSKARVFFNGIECDEIDFSGSFTSFNQNVFIINGRWVTAFNSISSGPVPVFIDNVVIWSKSLTQTDVENYHNNGKGLLAEETVAASNLVFKAKQNEDGDFIIVNNNEFTPSREIRLDSQSKSLELTNLKIQGRFLDMQFANNRVYIDNYNQNSFINTVVNPENIITNSRRLCFIGVTPVPTADRTYTNIYSLGSGNNGFDVLDSQNLPDHSPLNPILNNTFIIGTLNRAPSSDSFIFGSSNRALYRNSGTDDINYTFSDTQITRDSTRQYIVGTGNICGVYEGGIFGSNCTINGSDNKGSAGSFVFGRKGQVSSSFSMLFSLNNRLVDNTQTGLNIPNSFLFSIINDSMGQKDLLHIHADKGVRVGATSGESITMDGDDLYVKGHAEIGEELYVDGSVKIDDILKLTGLTSDPSSPTDGDIWHRTDTDEIRVRLNGVTKVINVSDP